MKKCDKRGYVGPEASGKSYAAIAQSAKESLLIRVDLMRQEAMAFGADVTTSRSQLARAVKAADLRRRTVICYRPEGRDYLAEFNFVCRVACARKGRVAVHADEVETLIPKHGELGAGVEKMLRQGRQHYHVALYYTALRPADINVLLRNNTQAFFFYRGFDKPYQDFITSMADKDAAKAVTELQPYHYIYLEAGQKWAIRRPVKP